MSQSQTTPPPATHPDLARLKRIADFAEATLEQSMFVISPRGQSSDFFNDYKTVNRLAELTIILHRLMSVRKTLIQLEDPNYFRRNPLRAQAQLKQATQDLYEAAPKAFT